MSALAPCPFCGGAARIESNRDWHKLFANHDEDCVFDADDHDLMYPTQPGYLIEITEVWNRRAPLPAEQPSNPVPLTDSEILLLTCQHTGQRISLRADECQQHIDFARAIEARIVGQQTKGGGNG